MNENFGNISKESNGFDRYKAEQWIQLERNSGIFFGKLANIDLQKGEIVFSEITEYIHDEKGYVLGITKEPTTFHITIIQGHKKASEEEVHAYIDDQSMWYRHFGEYVSVPSGNIHYLGRIHKILHDSVELLPFMNFEFDKPYIENKKPLSLRKDSASQIIPISAEELEHRVKELFKKIEEEKAKSNKTP